MYKNLIAVLLIFALPFFTLAQKRAFTIEDLYKVKNVGAPVVSPSGNKIAYTVSESFLSTGKSSTNIYVMNADGTEPVNITSKAPGGYSPIWNGDDEVYFSSAGILYSYSFNTFKTLKVVDFSMGVSDPVLSNDGRYILFTSEIFPECGVDEDCNKELDESVSNGPLQAYVTDELLFRHWTDYKGSKKTALILYDIDEDEYQLIATSDVLSGMYLLGGSVKYNFSPDSKEICFVSSPEKNLAASTNADMYIIQISDTVSKNITSTNKAWDGHPVYSPDGNYIAYKIQLTPDYEADRYRVAIYNRNTNQSEVLTEAFDYTVDNLTWSEDSRSIYFNADYQGYSPVYKVDIQTKKVDKITDDKSIFGYTLPDANSKMFVMYREVGKPGEIYSYDVKEKSYNQLTFYNKQLMEEVDIRPAEQIWVKGADGIPVHVFIVKPHNFDPNKKYPLVLNVHGGPQSQWMDSFRGDWQVYPGYGYIVAFPNPHGSTGYGSKYTEAISGDWGGKVYEDVMKVTDELEKLPYVDKDRIGAMGWSYGGYMMNWLQGKTKRFKCLASMMGIFDIESMWGVTEELWFVNWDVKGQPWNSDLYKKFSPSNLVENFSTPTLIITGERDYRVSYTQSVQYFTTLRTLGIDSRLVIFKNDGHWPSGVKSMPLYYNAHLEWFHKYLGGDPAPYDSKEMVKNTAFEK
ncbi:MAG: S9 family peptidase [Ignavibacteriales bacterium]|nr:MAG: S9 family peptidase [Ignavibacteriales bacterium]